MKRLRLRAVLVWVAAPLVLAACAVLSFGTHRNKDMAMIPQTTYLHLLKNTPFFTALTRQQLRWVIDHSHEWEVKAGTVIASSTNGESAVDDLWILLDGRWRVEIDGKQYAAGNTDEGKWFSSPESARTYQLISIEKSYVMKISRADMDDMLKNGFDFGTHLRDGRRYYQTVFQVKLGESFPSVPN